ncbi:MAG: hypothetical protein RR479_13190 [Acinetobacter sp.]
MPTNWLSANTSATRFKTYFRQAEIVPALIELDWSEVYWYWDGEK